MDFGQTLKSHLSNEEKQKGNGLDSDEEKQEGDNKPKGQKKIKHANVADLGHVLEKSRNYKARINYEQKSRIFAGDIEIEIENKKKAAEPELVKVRNYMFDYFKDIKDEQ